MNTRIVTSIPFVSLRPMHHATNLSDYEFDPLQSTTVVLSAPAMEWAVQICQQVTSGQQWATFLQAIALRGVQDWLESGATGLRFTYDLTQPPIFGVQGEVNGFRLCIVPQGIVSDGQVTIPRSTLDDAQGFAHLYLLAAVQEEADQVTILCGLRRDRLLAQRDTLVPANEDTYAVPLAYFDTSPEEMLLYLNCLNPTQLETAAQTTPSRSPSQGVINVGRWLSDRLDTLADTVASTLTWALLPPLSVSHAMMSGHTPAEALETVLRELEPAGVVIPPMARGAYTDLQTAGVPLRLYALTWTHLEGPQPEWCLFLVLGPAPGEQLLPGTRLMVRDAATVLADSILSPNQSANHLYAQVFGTWDEAFAVSVELPNGSTVSWPPFVFQPEEG
ncbi:DUF1822 family protein [Nodosilinea sp. LEGE 07298]|uniref:DUF1822 family protein n=1 Tax=Nodosilinea sp. LEGE 07298 TaxID=2777970 RepID=UPI001D1577F2|nr:DUF1822 family protein [Nodosilinea sp. LEGE 07298]